MTGSAELKGALTFRLAGGRQSRSLLPVSVDGAPPRQFILDTGAGTTLLSREFARELGVEVTGPSRGTLLVERWKWNSVAFVHSS
jgi:predicted aspartyl protease